MSVVKKPSTPAKKSAPTKKDVPTTETKSGTMEIYTDFQHARTKGMWAGAQRKIESKELLGAWEVDAKEPAQENENGYEGTENGYDGAENGYEAEPHEGEQNGVEDEDKSETESVAESVAESVTSGKDRKRPLKPAPIGMKVGHITRSHTPAALKIFDELGVNATDFVMECRVERTKSEQVTYIAIEFDPITGRFSIENDGPGLEVVPHEKGTQLLAGLGRTIYNPEVACTVFKAGTNLTKTAKNKYKGGSHGFGLKVVVANSKEFTIETVDSKKRYFSQTYHNRMKDETNDRSVPIIYEKKTKTLPEELQGLPASRLAPHTRVEILPAYAELDYKPVKGNLPQDDGYDLDGWLRLRTHQMAAYVGPKVKVTYNGKQCMTTSANELARLFCTQVENNETSARTIIMNTTLKNASEEYKKFPMDVALVIFPAGTKGITKIGQMTIINGVVVNKGNHLTYLRKCVSDTVLEKIEALTKSRSSKKKSGATKNGAKPDGDKKLTMADAMANVRVVASGVLLEADWAGQRKDELEIGLPTMRNFPFKQTFLKTAAGTIADSIILGLESKTKRRTHIEKYTKARFAGSTHRAQCALLVAEGDSAMTLLRNGLSQNKSAKRPPDADKRYIVPNTDFCGRISLGGVPMNAMKKTTEFTTLEGEHVLVRSHELRNNAKLRALTDAMHLDFDKTYETASELASLQYGYMYACVDQDLDGCGKILTLFLVYIHLFWPWLLKHGRIGRFLTPVIRMYPKNKKGARILEFHYEEEAKKFMAENPNWNTTHHKPNFYKGLAGHDDDEARDMFMPENFNKNLYLFTLDDGDKALFNLYYGNEKGASDRRKGILRSPVEFLTFDEAHKIHQSRMIPCAMHLRVDTKAFKLEAIRRQIPHVSDGLIPAGRKVVDAALEIFGSKTEPLKVFQLGGRVAAERFYHHGDASLNGTITRMAQMYPGAREIPLLAAHGQFGSRHSAGKDAGSARYIGVSLCPVTRPLFSRPDHWLLKFVQEDGGQAEPEYFVPPAPMAVLESGGSRPSEGWAHTSYARDYEPTMKIVYSMLDGNKRLIDLADKLRQSGPTDEILEEISSLDRMYPLPLSKRNFTGEVRNIGGVEWSVGDYYWDEKTRTVCITELPHCTPTGGDEKDCPGYICSIMGKGEKKSSKCEFIESYKEDCGGTTVDIRFKLKEGAFETIDAKYGNGFFDSIEEFFKLRESMTPNLNYVGYDGTVLEFRTCYLAVLLYWFPERRDMYRRRLEREQILLNLRIVEQQNILRYCDEYDQMNLKKFDEEKASALLSERKYVRLNSALLHSPGFSPTETLQWEITEGPKISHDYLLDLKDRQKLPAAVKKRREDLIKLEGEVAENMRHLQEQPFAGVTLWKQDLAEFDKQVKQGWATNWKFKSAGRMKRARDAEKPDDAPEEKE